MPRPAHGSGRVRTVAPHDGWKQAMLAIERTVRSPDVRCQPSCDQNQLCGTLGKVFGLDSA